MLTVITLLKVHPSPNGEQHGERAFWREFGERYLDAWLSGVRAYVPEPRRIVVMTDVLHYVGAPSVLLDKTVDAPGFWAKLEMFRDDVSHGKCLYLDLDNVINGDLSALCALTPDPLIMLDDRRVPGLPNGSAILFDAEACRGIWERYAQTPREIEREYVARGDDYSHAYDQAFIANWLCYPDYVYRPTFLQDLLPEGYILNARSELPNAADWRTARLVFGGGSEKEGKIHTSTHPGYSFRA
jgi:hypothetical protein